MDEDIFVKAWKEAAEEDQKARRGLPGYAGMTDEELDEVIEKKYGKDWSMDDIQEDEELYHEYWTRIASGY